MDTTDRMIRPRRQLHQPGPLLSAILLLGAALLWPAVGFGATGSFLFPAGDGSCYDVKPLEAHSQRSSQATPAPDVESSEPPCTVDDSDPASNICLEAANSPISTLPSLIAKANGKETADGVVNSILERIERSDADAPQVDLAITPSPDPQPADDDSKVACSTDSEECRSLPPAPPTLQVEASAAGNSNLLAFTDLPDTPDDGGVNAWADLRVGPEDGHQRRPDRPPQRA